VLREETTNHLPIPKGEIFGSIPKTEIRVGSTQETHLASVSNASFFTHLSSSSMSKPNDASNILPSHIVQQARKTHEQKDRDIVHIQRVWIV